MILIKNGRLLDPARNLDRIGDIQIDDGKIVAMGEGLSEAGSEQVIDAVGKVVAPGFIDIHVHLRVPGQEYKEDMVTGTAAAVRGGITGMVCMPNTSPVLDNAPLISYLVNLAKMQGLCHVWPTGAITKGLKGEQLAEIGEMREAGIVAITDDGRPVPHSETMRLAMMYAKQWDLMVMDHSEDKSLSAGGAIHEGKVSALLGVKGIPRAAEEVHVARNILLALETGAHVHIQHVSSKNSVALIRWGKSMGANVTCEATPHHFTLTDEIIHELNYSANAKMSPPVREESDREAILEGIQDGTIDIIATDHAPHHIDEKRVELQDALFGITGLETSVGLTLDRLVHRGIIDLPKMVLMMSTRPAELVGLTPPALAVGAAADITVFDPEHEWTVKAEEMASRSKNSPFIGWKLRGAPYATVVNGKLRMLKMQVIGA